MNNRLASTSRIVLIAAFWLAAPQVGLAINTAPPPSDAVVLFDGTDASGWVQKGSGEPCGWKVEDGALIATGAGDVQTKAVFGDHQLHVEFRIPKSEDAEGQADGNSGVYVQGDYEVQVLNSHGQEPPSNADCGAIFDQYAPMVNVSLPAGEWQSFDILFKAPRFDSHGKRQAKARITVFHNGVLIHDDIEIEATPGGVGHDLTQPGPLMLQWHGSPVAFRNIWARHLDPEFRSLFNGEDLEGWEIVGNTPESWRVEDGAIRSAGEPGGWLRSAETWGNFSLRLQFMSNAGVNSGIFVRSAREGTPWITGWEVQILDTHGRGINQPNQHTAGSIYDVLTPMLNTVRPAGEWNDCEIICRNHHVVVYLNGYKIIDTDFSTLTEPIGKFETPYSQMPLHGHLGFQHYGRDVWFRNIEIAPLP